jgi:hypothetical protein
MALPESELLADSREAHELGFSGGRITIASSGAGFYILSASSTDPSRIDLM